MCIATEAVAAALTETRLRAIIFVLVLAVSIGTYFSIVQLQQEWKTSEETQIAKQISEDIAVALKTFVTLTHTATVGFERADEVWSERQFQDVSATLLEPYPSTFAFLWTPKVLHSERAAYEEEVRQAPARTALSQSFRTGEYWVIRDRAVAKEGGFVRPYRANFSVYYPVRYLYTARDESTSALVWNMDTLALEPARRDAVLSAANLSQPVISASVYFKLLKKLGGAIMVPTASGNGVVRLSFLYQDLLEITLQAVQRPAQAYLKIWDATDAEKVLLLTAELTTFGVKRITQTLGTGVPEEFHKTSRMEEAVIGTRKFLFELHFLASNAAYTDPIALLLGFVMFLVLSAAFLCVIWKGQRLLQVQQLKLVKLETARSTQERLMNYLCHEMRNPLHVITFCSDSLNDSKAGVVDRDVLSMLKVNSTQLGLLVNGWLDVSKSMQMSLNLQRTPVQVGTLVKGTYDEFRMMFQQLKPGIVWTFEASTGLEALVLEVDAMRLRQIIVNGLSNATKHTTSGTISVRVRAQTLSSDDATKGQEEQKRNIETNELRVRVAPEADCSLVTMYIDIADSGSGLGDIDPEDLFQEFTQGVETIADVPSTGLGLSIARHLARLMGGDVRLTNADSGIGAVFSLCITARQLSSPDLLEIPQASVVAVNAHNGAFAEEVKNATSAEVCRKTYSQIRPIYVCDDDMVQIEIMKRMLVDYVNVHFVLDSTALLRLIDSSANTPPRLVVTDITLNGDTGFHVLESLRKRGLTTAVIACTASVSKPDLEKYKAAGFAEVVAKPFTKASLVEAIERVLSSSG